MAEGQSECGCCVVLDRSSDLNANTSPLTANVGGFSFLGVLELTSGYTMAIPGGAMGRQSIRTASLVSSY